MISVSFAICCLVFLSIISIVYFSKKRIKNMDNKNEVIDTITLFGFSAEEMLEAGAEYEDVMALGSLVR